MFRALREKLLVAYLKWKYHNIEDDVCCCGDYIKNHGWQNHAPKSQRAWAIESYRIKKGLYGTLSN